MKTTNKLTHKITEQTTEGRIVITISLDDDCNNGHCDFSITAVGYDKNGRETFGGCCHEEILKARPDLELFTILHLADSNGAPMYAVENGFYSAKESTFESTKKLLRTSNVQTTKLIQAPDKQYFAYLLTKMGIIKSWNEDAKTAIKWLEEKTGLKFKDTGKKPHTIITTKQILTIEKTIAAGYYTNVEIENRAAIAKKHIQDKTIAAITEERDKAIKKANDEFNVQMAIIQSGLSNENVIYYNHTNEVVFNWLDYCKKVTELEFDTFVKKVNKKQLPKGIKFSLKSA